MYNEPKEVYMSCVFKIMGSVAEELRAQVQAAEPFFSKDGVTRPEIQKTFL